MIEYVKWLLWLFILVTMIFNLRNLKEISAKQKSVKWVLNLLLMAVLGLFLFQPKKNTSFGHNNVLVFSEGIRKSLIDKISDSLKIKTVVSSKEFEKKLSSFADDNLVILGEDLSPEIVSNWTGKEVKWYTDSPNIQWDGILRLGEAQNIKGDLYVEVPQLLKVVYENTVLDSVQLYKGFNSFNLSFNTFALGRNRVDLYIGSKKMESCHFFVRASNKFPIEIYSEYPDFELKNLGEWLGGEGYSILTNTKVAQSTEHRSEININKKDKPELLITTSENTSKDKLKKYFIDGKSIFILNILNVEPEIAQINKNLGTQFSVKRISSEPEILIQKDIYAHPYQWQSTSKQLLLEDLPINKEKNVNVSLLKETFPLKLSGDSLSYRQIWLSILAAVAPLDSNKIELKAPIYKQAVSKVDLYTSKGESLNINGEMVQGETSSVNPYHKMISYIFDKNGWQTLNDSLEIYVEETNNKAFLKEFLKTNRVIDDLSSKDNPMFSDTVWFLIIVLILVLLWVEPKFKY